MSANALVPAAFSAITVALLSSCISVSGGAPRSELNSTLESRSGSTVTGNMRFTERSGVVRLHGSVKGLAPDSEHGFHIHEKGDCSAADASSAGGHFNPGGSAHGKHSDAVHHAGDLPSLKADAKGEAHIDVVLTGVTLGEGTTSIKGRSLVVHGKADDFTTQPSGNSGPRVACGVI
jgi:Cu-Zn family superoxide dismutase